MSFPIRCFSCGKNVASLEIRYNKLIQSGSSPKEALDTLGLSRYCCRRMFLGHVDITDQLLLFPKDNPNPSGTKVENPRE